jgi:hypothetical protein
MGVLRILNSDMVCPKIIEGTLIIAAYINQGIIFMSYGLLTDCHD